MADPDSTAAQARTRRPTAQPGGGGARTTAAAPVLSLTPPGGTQRSLRAAAALIVGLAAPESSAPAPRRPRVRPAAPPEVVVVSDAIDADGRVRLAAAFTRLGASSAVGRVSRLAVLDDDAGWPLEVIGVGLGQGAASWPPGVLRDAAAAGVRAAPRAQRIAMGLPLADAAAVGAVAEGAALGCYRFTAYTSQPEPPVITQRVDVLGAPAGTGQSVLDRAGVIAGAVGEARDLVNTPGRDLRPVDFVSRARRIVRGRGISVTVLDETALAREGYGGLIGVGAGSESPPRLLRLSYRPTGAVPHLCLVGKGITFDTGGYSLKPAKPMLGMKGDMAGAAAVLMATQAIAALRLPVKVTTYAALAENMVSGRAVRPGDVLTLYGGRTVEVLNTDAEGRLVLADALVRAQEDDPDLIVDLATLTGAAIVALGQRTAGVMGSDETVRQRILAAAGRAGEEAWGMPIPREMRASLESSVADIANISASFDPGGGMLKAAAFLQEFIAPRQAWAHLDIAGPAMNSGSPWGCTPTGGTGYGVRLLISLAEGMAGLTD